MACMYISTLQLYKHRVWKERVVHIDSFPVFAPHLNSVTSPLFISTPHYIYINLHGQHHHAHLSLQLQSHNIIMPKYLTFETEVCRADRFLLKNIFIEKQFEGFLVDTTFEELVQMKTATTDKLILDLGLGPCINLEWRFWCINVCIWHFICKSALLLSGWRWRC